MAQRLKETQRLKILDAAKNEFLKKGIEGTSLRAIARTAEMSVGNIYHYYGSKEEIAEELLKPVYRDINEVVLSFSKNKLSLFETTENFVMTEESFKRFMKDIAAIIAINIDRYRDEVLISVNDKKLNEQYQEWLLKLLNMLYTNSMPSFIKTTQQQEMYISMLATSIFSAIGEAVLYKSRKHISAQEFQDVLSNYLQMAFIIRP